MFSYDLILLYGVLHFLLRLSIDILVKESECEVNMWDGYVDYRSRLAQRGRHGSMHAALFLLGT